MRKYKHGIGVMILAFFMSIATKAQVTVTINQAQGQSDPANAGFVIHVNFIAVFNQAVTGFTSSDITLSGTAGATQAIVTEIAPNDGTTFTIAVIGMTTDGTVIATIPANVVTGPNGVLNSASTSVDNTITYQLTCIPTCPNNILTDATFPSGANVNYDISTFGDCRSMLSLPGSGSFPIGTTTVNVYTTTHAEYMYVLTSSGLYKFDPGNQTATLSGPIAITGLPTGYAITSIDFSPTGQLYGLGKYACNGSSLPTCARVFSIDKVTGAATQIGTQDFTLINGGHELEFDPVTNTIHIIGSIYQEHYVMDITTGYTTLTSFKEGEPFMKGVAFSNNFPGTTFTTLYAVGTDGNLHTIGGMHGDPAPSMTAITLVGDLNPDPNGPFVGVSADRTSFDISQRGNAYMISDNNFSSINLNTGEASLLGIFTFETINDFSIEPETLASPVCSFTVTVNPLQPCEVVCPDDIISDATSSSGAVVNYNISTTGYCPDAITTLPASGSTFPVGTTTVNAYENYSQKVFALITANQLVSFDITTPNIASAPLAITGLVQPPYFEGENFFFENLIAIDFRPSNGMLYGLGIIETTGTTQLYTINTTNGVATPVGTTFQLNSASNPSIDFNPVTDELRIVVGSILNLRLDPDLGTIIASDPGVTPFTTISGIAYNNNVSSATSTTLYDLSPESNSLFYQGGTNQTGSANTGVLTLVGQLGLDFVSASFDITQAGVGIAQLFTTLGSNPFYTIDLGTGAPMFVNEIAMPAGHIVHDIAAAPLSVSPSCSFTVTVNPPQPPTITCPTTNITLYTELDDCNVRVDFAEENYITITGSPAPKISFTSLLPSGSGSGGSGLDNLPVIYFNVGVNTVTFTATNDGGTATCSFTVTVIDNKPPVIVCPEDKVVNAVPGTCKSATVPITIIVTEGCRVNVTAAHGTSSVGWGINGAIDMPFNGGLGNFPVGVNTVSVIASDASGNTSTCSFTVTVNDIENPVITSNPLDVTVECTSQIPAVNIASVSATDNCGTTTITHVGDVISNQICANKYTVTRTYKATDVSGNSATCSQTITVDDITPPTITGLTPSKRILAPPNHKMVNITLDYIINDNCSTPNVTINITSNEPVNGTGDGDTDPDWEVVDDHHIRLRAERSAQGNGRIYTITVTVDDGCNAPVSATTEVVVAHNITGPHSGNSFKVGSTVAFTGEFWDVPGNKHTAKWLIDGNTAAKASVTEPIGNKNGKVTGSYKFTSPGVYKLQMNITDQHDVTTYANTNGDVDAIVVVYDPNGGHTYGGGYFNSPAGALVANSSSTGKASYGFAMNYFKNSTNPKGETQFEFKVGDFEFNALNFDFLVISNSMSQFKGTGKIIGGQSGIGFTMTVVDGQLDGTGIDKIRMKIYNKNNGRIIYDNQPGASDAALPTQAVGTNSSIVISGNNSNLTKSNTTTQNAEMEATEAKALEDLRVTVYPNPASNYFNITINSNDAKEKIVLQVFDQYGRSIEVRNNVSIGSTVRLGDLYRSGVYYVRVIQGKQHKELKLVKLN